MQIPGVHCYNDADASKRQQASGAAPSFADDVQMMLFAAGNLPVGHGACARAPRPSNVELKYGNGINFMGCANSLGNLLWLAHLPVAAGRYVPAR